MLRPTREDFQRWSGTGFSASGIPVMYAFYKFSKCPEFRPATVRGTRESCGIEQ